MLVNIFGRWINPQNILAVISSSDNPEEKTTKIIFSSEAGFSLEFNDKTPFEVASEINTAIAANRKSSFGDRGERRGGGDRGGFKGGDRGGRGGDRGGFKKKFDRDERPAHGSDEHKEKVRKDFSDRKEGGRKFESPNRRDFKPKKRKDW